jgi:hypothetical protein
MQESHILVMRVSCQSSGSCRKRDATNSVRELIQGCNRPRQNIACSCTCPIGELVMRSEVVTQDHRSVSLKGRKLILDESFRSS